MSAQPMFPNPNPRTLVRPVTLNRRQLCGVAAGGVLGGGTFLVRSASTEAAFFSAVGRLLSEFVLAVGVEAIWQLAPRFVDWASNLWDDEREAVERVNASAAGHGFSHCSHSPVYGNSFDPLALYVVDDDAGLNGCVPILAGGIYFPATAMIHGPAVAGITWAAQEWDYRLDYRHIAHFSPFKTSYLTRRIGSSTAQTRPTWPGPWLARSSAFTTQSQITKRVRYRSYRDSTTDKKYSIGATRLTGEDRLRLLVP